MDTTQEHDTSLGDKVALLEEILNDSNQLVQMSYLDDMTMVYVNGPAKAYRGGNENHQGRHCYEYMMGFKEQCPYCPLLTHQGEQAAYTEVDNGNQVFSVKTILTTWKGKPAFIEYAADVTVNRRAQQGFETQVQTLLQSIPEAQGIMHFDLTDDRCLTVNGSASNNLKSVQSNVAVNTTVRQTLSFVPNKEKREALFEIFNRNSLISAYQNGSVELSRETESYFDDGSVRWARITARIIQNPSNEHLECILYGMDISDEISRRKSFEEQSHHQLALFNTLAKDYLNVYLIDLETDTVKVLKLRGFVTTGLGDDHNAIHPYEATCEQYIGERVHPDDRNMMRHAMSIKAVKEALSANSEYVFAYRVIDQGETHYYQFKYVMAENGEGVLAGFQNIDSTIAKEREQQELLRTALAAAEEANASKSAFLSSMSHDIRTPLNAIIGFTDLAKKRTDDPAAISRYLEKVTTSSNHLLDLVNDVLDMSHIESGKVTLDEKPINLLKVLEDLHTIVAENARAAKIHLSFDTSGIKNENVLGDELKIKKVLLNILGNAVKFTEEGGSVTFSVDERKLRSSDYTHYVFHIRDTGIGMDDSFKSHAFDAFAREKAGDDFTTPGTGLGLSIAKSLINIMSGSIHLESEKGVGTEFTISLHLRAIEAKEEAPKKDAENAAGSRKSFEGKRVLLVEDNELNREISAEILKAAGFQVDDAEDGRVAVRKIADGDVGTYDLVLMDIQMPNMNGYEATRAIRNLPNPQKASIPIIATTANAFNSDRDEALAAGMDGHIAKPIDVALLIEKMCDLIK